MNTLHQIALHLKVSPIQIKRVESWDKVYLIVLAGKRPTFVSKKGIKTVDHPKVVDVALLAQEGQDYYALRLLITESVRRYHNTGNTRLALDLCRRFLGAVANKEDNDSIVRVSKACEVLTRANVCVEDSGAYILTEAGIRYGNMLIS